jgi:serine/threonine protein kinase
MVSGGGQRAGVALLIGIGAYRHADRVDALRFAPRDARALAKVLTDPDICAFPPDKVVLLTDDKARHEKVVHRLATWLPDEGRGADIVFIYFAGHGMVRRLGPSEDGFLLAHDSDPDDIAPRGIAMRDVALWMKNIQAKAVVVCLDCCHAGKVLPREGVASRSRTRDLGIRQHMLEDMGGQGRFLIASCQEGQKSFEVNELKHGLFTYHLLKGLKGAGDRDGDGKVAVMELFDYVSGAVARDAREKFGGEQRPWTQAQFGQAVYLAEPKRRPESAEDLSAIKHLWRTGGLAAALPEIEKQIASGDEKSLLSILRFLRRAADPTGLPAIFACLAHHYQSDPVCQQARRAIHAIGWDKTATAVEELARQGDAARLAPVLEGLAAFKGHADVVTLLDRLVILLKGDLRTRAILLLEHKRLSVELESVAALFREKQCPYRIEKVLGAGLFTAAYLARYEFSQLEVVVRVLRPEFARQPLIRAYFLDLSRRSVKFIHQNLVLTREARAFPDRDVYFTVRDYLDGATLRDVLLAGRKFEAQQIIHILREILEALQPLHQQGIVHGGVKPSNIFFAKGDRVVLGDASLPVPTTSGDLQRLSYDFRYTPPEMFRSGQSMQEQADFYALGCVAYELCCGAPPFVSDNHYELITKHDRDAVVPPSRMGSRLGIQADRWMLRLLAKMPQDRFGTIDDAIQALDALPGSGKRKEVVGEDAVTNFEEAPDNLQPEVPTDASAVHLMQDESLVQYGGGQSILPLDASRQQVSATNTGFAGAEPTTRPPRDPFATGADSWASPNQTAGPTVSVPGYEILEVLGRGGMGVVYKARQVSLNRLVALKMILTAAHAGPEYMARFQLEAQAIAHLQHPNIVQIYECGEHQGLPYFSLELVDGGSLARRVKGGPQPPQEAARCVEAIARAADYAHKKGIIHRDLKPTNVLLTRDGIPKITDFGLAKRVDVEVHATRSGEVMGTPQYMAPEQARGSTRDIGPATDVYALGAILYELLTGRPPFKAASAMELMMQHMSEEPVPPRRLLPLLPRDLETICLKCLVKQPTRRYATAEALADDLGRFLAKEPISARPITLWQRFKRLITFHRR